MKKFRKILRIVWIIFGISFTIALIISFQARGVDKNLLQSSDHVKVVNDSYKIEFTPLNSVKDTAMVFYPGGFVDPKAYVPMARKIAENGYRVVIEKLPLRIAFSQSQKQELFSKTKKYIQNHKEISHWVLGGHSRGAALAAEFAKDESEYLDSLLLIGTTHPKEFDLSDYQIDVTKIIASNDGLASEKEVEGFSKNLPPNTNWIKIEGGNHSQFGYYSFQIGDKRATITRKEQQIILFNSVMKVLHGASSK